MSRYNHNALDYLSPPALILLSLALACISIIIPPIWYASIIHEPDLMFGNMLLLIFYFGMCAIFTAGFFASRKLRITIRSFKLHGRVKLNLFAYLTAPVLIAEVLVAYTLEALVEKLPNALAWAFAGEAQLTKNALASVSGIENSLSGSIPVAMAVLWWSVWTWLHMKSQISRWLKYMSLSLVLLLLATLTAYSLVIAARNIMIPLYFGFALIYLVYRASSVTTFKMLILAALGVLALLLVFNLFSMMRGYHGGEALKMIVGYIPTSFNHLAALLDGRLDYSFNGIEYSNFQFVLQPPLLGRYLNVAHVLGFGLIPLNEQFANATYMAGLNGEFVWVTAFGYIYADLGLLTPIFVFGWGILAGLIWKSFQKGRLFGVIFYPWLAFSIIFLFGSNYFFSNYLTTFFISYVMLSLYRKFVILKVNFGV
jgi:hypothetical protein